MSRSTSALLLLLALAGLPALELQFDPEMEPAPTGLVPGRVPPAALPDPVAVTFTWDEYRTLVVVAPSLSGKSLRAPAWVVTYDLQGQVQVAYRATAFRDQTGLLHIDARRAIISGPRHEEWSADSFTIAADGTVQAIDDNNRGNGGTVSETVRGRDSGYPRLLVIAMAIVREMS